MEQAPQKQPRNRVILGNRPHQSMKFSVPIKQITSKDDILQIHVYSEDFFCNKDLIAMALYLNYEEIKIYVNDTSFPNIYSKSQMLEFIIEGKENGKVICFYDKKAKTILQRFFENDAQLKDCLKDCLIVSQTIRKLPALQRHKTATRRILKNHCQLINSPLNKRLNLIMDKDSEGVFKIWKTFSQNKDINYANKVIQCLTSQVLSLSSLVQALRIEYLNFQQKRTLLTFVTGTSSIDKDAQQSLILQAKQQLARNKEISQENLQQYVQMYHSNLQF